MTKKKTTKKTVKKKVQCIMCKKWVVRGGKAHGRHAFAVKDVCEIYESKAQGGRPTKYSVAILKKAQKYVDTCTDKHDPFERDSITLPTLNNLCKYLDISPETLSQWRKDNTEFSETVASILMEQSDRLVNGGLSGKYNPTITKLLLNVNHGMVERKEITGKDGESLFSSLIDDIDEDEEDNN